MGVMVTFLDVARMVDATAMMGVLGWGGGDGNDVAQRGRNSR